MAPGILTARENLPPAANPLKKDQTNDYGPLYPKGRTPTYTLYYHEAIYICITQVELEMNGH